MADNSHPPDRWVTAVTRPSRFLSLDAARGLLMGAFILVRPLIPAVASLPAGPLRDFLNEQLHHSPWHGLTKADVTFGAFVVLLGVMIPVSLQGRIGGRALYWRIGRRFFALFLLGLVYNGGFSQRWPDVRLAGVLQRLAICYLVGAIVYLNANTWMVCALTAVLLLGYWAVMALVRLDGGGAGDYTFDGNLAAVVDRHYLPGRAFFGTWDPEGILTTIPALASCLIGICCGILFMSRITETTRLLWLAAGGLVAINLGAIWDYVFPINKSLWTSSYVLVTSGIAFLLLAACYVIADVWRRPQWFYPFIVIGRNLLPAYLIAGLIPLRPLVERVVGGDVADLLGSFSPLAAGLVEAAMLWGVLFWMYKHNVVLKV